MHIMHIHRQRLDVHTVSTRLITAGIVAAIVMTETLTAANAQADCAFDHVGLVGGFPHTSSGLCCKR